jgi:hypothetical protein
MVTGWPAGMNGTARDASTPGLRPLLLAQAPPVLDGFANMLRPDPGDTSEIGNRPRYL